MTFLLIRSSGWLVFLKTKSGRINGRRSRVEENLRVENDLLRKEKKQLTDEKNDLAQHVRVLETEDLTVE